jgi:hypothetical protein
MTNINADASVIENNYYQIVRKDGTIAATNLPSNITNYQFKGNFYIFSENGIITDTNIPELLNTNSFGGALTGGKQYYYYEKGPTIVTNIPDFDLTQDPSSVDVTISGDSYVVISKVDDVVYTSATNLRTSIPIINDPNYIIYLKQNL